MNTDSILPSQPPHFSPHFAKKTPTSLPPTIAILPPRSEVLSHKTFSARNISADVHEKIKELAIANTTKKELLNQVKAAKEEHKKWEHSELEEKLRFACIVLLAVVLVTLIIGCVLVSHGAFLASIPWFISAGVAFIPLRDLFTAYESKKIQIESFEKWEQDLDKPEYQNFLKEFINKWAVKNDSRSDAEERFLNVLLQLHQSLKFYELWDLYKQKKTYEHLEISLAKEVGLIEREVSSSEETPLLAGTDNDTLVEELPPEIAKLTRRIRNALNEADSEQADII